MTELGKEVDVREPLNLQHGATYCSEFLKESTEAKDVDIKEDDTLDESAEVDVNTKQFSINENRKDGLQLV